MLVLQARLLLSIKRCYPDGDSKCYLIMQSMEVLEDPSNKPLEWTGRQLISAAPPKILACHSGAALDRPNRRLRIRISWDAIRHG